MLPGTPSKVNVSLGLIATKQMSTTMADIIYAKKSHKKVVTHKYHAGVPVIIWIWGEILSNIP